MSNSTQGDQADIASVESFVTATRIVTAAAALYSYEWITTLDHEIEHFWASKWNLTTLVFFGTRYGAFAYTIAQLLPTSNITNCIASLHFTNAGDLLQLFCSALFTALRTSALCNRSIWVFLIVFVLDAVPFAVNVFLNIKAQTIFEASSPTNICEDFAPFTVTQELEIESTQPHERITLCLRLATITADIIALIVSYRKALGSVREASRFHIKVPLSKVLVYDGTALFLGLTAINIYILVTVDLPILSSWVNGVNFLLQPLQPMLINRFIMNLRQASHLPGPNNSMERRSTIRFNADILIGSLSESESLAFGGQQEEEAENKRESEEISDTPSPGEAHRDLKASCPPTISDKDLPVSSDAEDAIITEEARTF